MDGESLGIELTGDDEPHEEPTTQWEGYADYRKVSLQVAHSINQAVDAYARIDSAHHENATVKPELAAEARSRILSAALKLIPEMESDTDVPEKPYDEILARWKTDDDADDPGFIQRLNHAQLTDESPSWLFQMVLDMRRAGWELGYLRAGRKTTADNGDPVEQETDAMLTE